MCIEIAVAESHPPQLARYMRFRKLPMDLRSRIREYVQHTEGGYNNFMKEARILKGLSPTLRYEVIKHVNTDIIESVPLFESENKEFIVEMTKVLRAEYYSPGDSIVLENTIGRKMYILAKGMVEIIKWDSFRVGVLVEGQYFGEMAILGNGNDDAKRVSYFPILSLTFCCLPLPLTTSYCFSQFYFEDCHGKGSNIL